MEDKIVLNVKETDFQSQVKFVRMYLQISREELARNLV